MKNQIKKRLDFSKSSIVELNKSQLIEIEGGTSLPCLVALTSSRPCADAVTRTSITRTNEENNESI